RPNTSGASVTIAFNLGFSSEIRSRYDPATSTGETSRRSINCAIVVKECSMRSLILYVPSVSFCGSFSFLQLPYIIVLLCLDSLAIWPSAKEGILGYSFEQDLRLAQAASAFRHRSSRTFSFRTLLHQLKVTDGRGRLQ